MNQEEIIHQLREELKRCNERRTFEHQALCLRTEEVEKLEAEVERLEDRLLERDRRNVELCNMVKRQNKLVSYVKHIAKQSLRSEYKNEEGEEIDDTTCAEAYDIIVTDARTMLAEYRTIVSQQDQHAISQREFEELAGRRAALGEGK